MIPARLLVFPTPAPALMAYHSMHVSARALLCGVSPPPRNIPGRPLNVLAPLVLSCCGVFGCLVCLSSPPIRHVMIHFYMDSPHRFRRGNMSDWETSQTCAFEASTTVLALDCSDGDFKWVVGQVGSKGEGKRKKKRKKPYRTLHRIGFPRAT